MKKYFILLTLCFSVCSFAQIVSLPDTNFKNYIKNNNCADFNNDGLYDDDVDTNDDGEIQLSEAQAVSRLSVDTFAGITSIEGIQSFTNLVSSVFNNNNLSALPDGFISSTPLMNTFRLNGNNSPISLNLTGWNNLVTLSCISSEVNSLVLTGLSELEYVDCSQNNLTTLDFTGLQNLVTVICNENALTSMDLSGRTSLQTFVGYRNFFSYLDLSNTSISTYTEASLVDPYNSDGESIKKFTNCTNLLAIVIQEKLSELDVTGCTALLSLRIWNPTSLLTLDLSNNTAFNGLQFDSDQLNLETIFMKNGRSESVLLFGDFPNLSLVCADESQISSLTQLIPLSSVNINSYCSFTPGGNYNTITGTTTFDSDNNGCDANDTPQPNIKISINDGTNQGATFTNNAANYNFYTQSGSYTLTPNIENPSWFTFSPNSATIPFANSNNNVVTQNFCIASNGVHPDVEIVIAPITPARPGFDAVYQIVYKNKGNQTLSGNITFIYNEEVLDFVSATTLPVAQITGLLNWNYQNLQPFENRSIYVTLNVNSPQEIPAVNIDDVLNFQVTITPVIGDDMAEDNLFSYNQTVVGSFDPNDITCVEGEVVPPSEIGEYLHYIINFENTGTAEAENIVVKVDVDPTKFTIDSLQMLNTSHNAYIRQAGNKVEFIFQEVWLDTGGHGNVLLKIRSKNSLLEGDSVAKKANIYFDYNFPIETNLANTTFEVLSSGNFTIDESVTAFPNPTASIININCNNTIKTVELYDVQGRLLQIQMVDSATTSLDISNKTNGIYFAKITSEKGVKVEKISKE